MTSSTVVTRVLPLALLTLALVPGCGLRGSGTPATEVREVESFDQIELAGSYELVVHVEPGAAQQVVVTADDNIIGMITTTVSDRRLEVETNADGKRLRPEIPMRVEVWVPALLAIKSGGASTIEAEGLHGERFELVISGASVSTLRGLVDRFDVTLSGAGDVQAKDLQAKTVSVVISGAAEAAVWASESLDVTISGAGEVTYWGNPANLSKRISGAGELKAGR